MRSSSQPADHGNDVGNEERDPGPGHEHGGEDRVANQAERSDCNELGVLALVDTDPPAVSHRELGEKGARDAEAGEDHA